MDIQRPRIDTKYSHKQNDSEVYGVDMVVENESYLNRALIISKKYILT